MKKIILGTLVSIALVGCVQAPIQLPSNVSTISMQTGGKQTQIDKIDESFISNRPVDFDKLKICGVDTFSNNTVTLNDTSGSFVGAYTGIYYQKNNTQVVNGSNSIKYIDDKNHMVVFTGNVRTKPQVGGFVIDIIQYDVKIWDEQGKTRLVFQNILRAQKDSGAVANNGFNPIGTWSGSRAPVAIEALHGLAEKFKSCVNGN
ncbi:hypothetical protein [Acinetobacter brisouii]